ncbi:putative O-glycosylation ligase, exosortase A system-associated [Propionivibrio sp.]|uniref:putative O-glycosylation ligase, exosortase A system-associated n=1 Tax=Propionivibrio sp. TaxID=2212460 RepID=UPI0039E41CEC
MRDIVLLSGFLAMLLLGKIFRYPHIGALLWCWTALLIPNTFVYGFARAIHYNKIVAIVALASWLFSREPKKLPWNGTLVLFVLFGICGTVSAFTAISSSGDALREWQEFLKIVLFVFVVAGLMTSKDRIIALLYAAVLSLGFHGVLAGAKFIASRGGSHIYGPGSSIIGDNNHFALAVITILPVFFYLYRQATHRFLRWGLLGSIPFLVATVIGTSSRGGLIGLVAVGFLAFIRSPKKIRNAIIAVPLIIAAVSFAPQRWADRMDTIKSVEEDTSFMGRVIAWKQSTLIALDNPLFGGGFYAVQDLAVWLKYAREFRKLDFIPTPDPNIRVAFAAHSIYFQTLGDLGFVGLGLFLAILFTSWRNASNVIRAVRDRPDWHWARDLARTLQYSIFAYVVAGAALNMAYFDFMYMVFAILIALRGLVDCPKGNAPVRTGSMT